MMQPKVSQKENNYAWLISRHLQAKPSTVALYLPTKWDEHQVITTESLTFAELIKRSAAVLAGLKTEGFRAGDRIIVLFPVSIDLYILLLAMLAGGMCPVFIDTGMSLKRIAYGLKAAEAKGIISFRKFLKLRIVLPPLWKLKLYSVDSGGWGITPFSKICNSEVTDVPLEICPCKPNDHAIITFTSGSTGSPKAADRNHGLLIAQYESIKRTGSYDDKDICMTCFPVFTLYNLACGITSVLPAVDFQKLSNTNGKLIAKQLQAHSVNVLGGGPAFMDRICDYLLHNSDLPKIQIKRIGVGGGPVTKKLCQKIHTCFPNAESWILYGSTEAEPVSHIDMREILKSPAKGNLVGKPVDDIRVMIVKLPEHLPLPKDKKTPPQVNFKSMQAKPGESGDILLQGKHVLDRYFQAEDTQRTKILDEEGAIWHRLGDVAHFNEYGQLVLVGRYNDFIHVQDQYVYPLTVETPISEIPAIKRTAFIALEPHNHTGPVLALELEEAVNIDMESIKSTIETLFKELNLLPPPIFKLPKIPVDGRHNSKIDRVSLRNILKKRSCERYRI